jgi:hypothetical protein
MARQAAHEEDTSSVEFLMAKAVQEEEWETVTQASPTRIVFDTIGDTFVGDYAGTLDVPAEQNITRENPEGEAFSMYLFNGLDGELYSLNRSTKLELGMSQVDVGRRCKLTYVKDVPTGRKLNPMKDITVQVAKSR